jgi:hypothetical protein
VNWFDRWLTPPELALPSKVMRHLRILLLPLLAVTMMSGTALAAPGDPYVVYTANSFSTGAVILRVDPAPRGACSSARTTWPWSTMATWWSPTSACPTARTAR